MKIVKIIFPVIFGMSFLSACGGSAGVDQGNSTPVRVTDTYKVNVSGDPDLYIYKTTVDGVPCFVLDGVETGSIECDWNN